MGHQSWELGWEQTARDGRNAYLDISCLYHARILPLRKGETKIKEKRSQVLFKDYRSPGLLWILKPHCVLNTGRGQSQRSAIIWEAVASCISPSMNSRGEKEPSHVLGSANGPMCSEGDTGRLEGCSQQRASCHNQKRDTKGTTDLPWTHPLRDTGVLRATHDKLTLVLLWLILKNGDMRLWLPPGVWPSLSSRNPHPVVPEPSEHTHLTSACTHRDKLTF